MLKNPKTAGFIFEGDSSKDVLNQVWKAIKKYGSEYQTQRGLSRSFRGATLIINNPLDKTDDYPYWSKTEDEWYQDNFVRKETNLPPELTVGKGDIHVYKYAWRSRFYDSGYGYLVAFLKVMKQLKIKQIRLKNKADLTDLIKKTYRLIHPEITLAVLSWKGQKLINLYLKQPKMTDLELQSHRRDTLDSIITELEHSPNSRRAIIPSFIYPHIDHTGAAGGVPVYQNYQLYVNFDNQGKPTGLTSMHLHRAIDAFGGAQLDINHDRDWGKIASKRLKLPLEKIIIYINDVWASFDKSADYKHLTQKSDIKKWLYSVIDSYEAESEDIEERLTLPAYRKKLEYTLSKIN